MVGPAFRQLECAGLLSLAAAILLAGCDGSPPLPDDPYQTTVGEPTAVDGVYVSPGEIFGFQHEILELHGGRFRYWFSSDVPEQNPRYPQIGRYTVDGDHVVLDHPRMHGIARTRTYEVVNSHPVLWRDDALPAWRNDRRIHAYGVIFRIGDAPWLGREERERPSIQRLYDEEMTRRDDREYEERFNDLPAESREILRASTLEDDPELSTYKETILRARDELNPELVRQLIGMCARRHPLGVEANMTLKDIFCRTWLFPEEPYGGDRGRRRAALGVLIDAFDAAPDRFALIDVIQVFLAASEIGRMQHSIPDAGVYLTLSSLVRPAGESGTIDFGEIERGSGPTDPEWKDRLGVIAASCQSWCRARLDERFPEPGRGR